METKIRYVHLDPNAKTVSFYEKEGELDYRLIQELVGGTFDCYRTNIFDAYVHDEGLLIGLTPNYFLGDMLLSTGYPAGIAVPVPAGPAVVVGPVDRNTGYDTSVTDAAVNLIDLICSEAGWERRVMGLR